MSPAYLSNALPDMVSSTHEKLRQERANLWRAKYLNRQLTGDASWVPAEVVESSDDWQLFEPRDQGVRRQLLRKRKRQDDENHARNGNADHHSEARTESNDAGKEMIKLKDDDLPAQKNGPGEDNVDKGKEDMKDNQATIPDTTEGEQAAHATGDVAPESADAGAEDAVMARDIELPAKPELNGIDPTGVDRSGVDVEIPDKARPPNPPNHTDVQLESKVEPQTDDHASGAVSHAASDADDASLPPPPPPPRRITRALAANRSTSHSNAPTPPLSPASSSTTTTTTASDLQIDPLYLLPPSSNPATNFSGLPPEEALETRRLLTLYIQKQEESVRGYECILSKLLTAHRLRSEVLEMCKTEEHVGELSDGEDWIDAERWGLQPGELRKGRDEDEDVLVGEGHGDAHGIGNGGGAGGGGRKGKRRARN